MKPLAIDELIVNDEGDWLSVLRGAMGLAQITAIQSERSGRHPLISAVARPGKRFAMETYLDRVSDLTAARRLLMQYLNPEREVLRRLSAADWVVPSVSTSGIELMCGPWDVVRSGSIYYIRDMIHRRLGTLSGGWLCQPGLGAQIAEATTNLVTNPSVETNTTGWSAGGTNTVAQSTTQARHGNYALKCTYQDDATLAQFSITLTAAAHTYSAWLYIPSEFDGTTVSIAFSGFTSMSGGGSVNADLTLRDQWQRISTTGTPDAGDLSGQIVVTTSGTPTAGRYIYLDAVQVEAKGYATPYCDGSLGPAHTWSGTVHGSTSARTAAELQFDTYAASVISNQGSACGWYRIGSKASTRVLFDARGSSDNDRITIVLQSDEKIDAYINGGYRITNVGSGSTPDYGDALFWCLTWDFDANSYALYLYEPGGTLYSGTDSTSLVTPAVTTLSIGSYYDGSSQCNGNIDDALLLNVALSAADLALIYSRGAGARNTRWLNVLCEAVQNMGAGSKTIPHALVSSLVVDDEIRWRNRDGARFWRVTASGATCTVNNEGDDDAKPILYVTPKTALSSGGYLYKRWVPILWKAESAATNYPVLIALPDLTGKAQADGDDIRVKIDGVEIDRWLSGTVAAYNCWVNMDFSAATTATLESNILIGDTITELASSTSIASFPSTGILLIDSEAFTYTGKNNATNTFTGVTRATKGTSAAGHSAAATIYWIQHDTWVIYGNATVSAPTVNDGYKPAFNLATSTNDSWDYDEFGEDDGLRTASWAYSKIYGFGDDYERKYTANQYTNASPWEEAGIFLSWYKEQYHAGGKWLLTNACGITGINLQNGEYKFVSSATGTQYLKSLPAETQVSLTKDDTWRAWSINDAAFSSVTQAGFQMGHYGGTVGAPLITQYAECADITVTLDTTYTPDVTVNSEQTNYELSATIENQATGDQIIITATMSLNQTLEIDTDLKTVTLLDDGSAQNQAIEQVGGARRDWLRLEPGDNVLSWTESGVAGVNIDIVFDQRWFE